MRWLALYNKIIVLNILSNIFGEQIENYVQSCIIKLERSILEKYFSVEVDFVSLTTLNRMTVENYNIELEKNEDELISGRLKIQAIIDGFAIGENEVNYMASTMIPMVLMYEFRVRNQEYMDLYLEYAG